MSRRDVVRLSVVLAGASLVPGLEPEEAYGVARKVAPVGLELVTLTETSAVFTWYTGVPGTDDGLGRMRPAPADGEIVYGVHPARLNRRAGGGRETPYHHVEITGLEPGRTYYYQARSRGRAATATFLVGGRAAGRPTGRPGVFAFTTPQPPPGRFLFSVALCNDLHLGETVAGLIGALPWVKGISQVPGHPPYPEIMTEALVADARRRGARYLLAAGDISSEAAPADVGAARRLLDRFGTLGRDYFVARGNHDRAHEGGDHASCTPGRWQGRDCFRDGFFDGTEPTYFARDLNGLRVVGLDTYDKPGDGGDAGGLSAEQLSWLRAELRAHRDQPTLVFGHHPLLAPDAPQAIAGGSTLEVRQTAELLREYARTPGVFLQHAGHTHRNKRSILPGRTRVLQQEVGAVKEYPGGFTLLRVHTGGYALNFYKTRAPLAREWSERSRQELAGLWPQLSLGTSVADRNTVVARDLSGIRPA
ncbi:MAG TPA: metallophosphoesterase family protein [Thermomonospora sp.]|nr:metallophosphoesterase family protein [Thermomonospora sp.]